MSGIATIIQPSGAAGEIAPALRGRVDLAKYRAAFGLLRNWFSLPGGGIANRTGSQLIGIVYPAYYADTPRSFPRNIPFVYSTLQAYVLEFSQQKMRVLMNGGYVLEPSKAIVGVTRAAPGVFHVVAHGYASSDQIFVGGALGMTEINSNETNQYIVTSIDADHFKVTPILDFPIIPGTLIFVDTTTFGAYTGGGFVARVFTLTVPYLQADLPLLKYAQTADILTLTHPLYAPQKLTRSQHWVWTLTEIDYQAAVQAPITVAAVPYLNVPANPQFTYQYAVTAVTDTPDEESLISLVGQCNNNALDQDKGISNQITWDPPASGPVPVRYRVYATDRVVALTGTGLSPAVPTTFGLIGETYSTTLQDSNFVRDFTNQPPSHRDPFAVNAITTVNITAPGTGYESPVGTVTDSVGFGVGAQVNIFGNGGMVTNGYVANGGENYTSAVLTITDATGPGTGATGTLTKGPATGTWPGCCSFYSARALFAGSINQPETLWASQTGNYNNMDVHQFVQDDDAITVTLLSQQVNAIKHLVSLSSLLAMTSDGAWQISGGQQTTAFTPSTIQASAQAFNGCSDVRPITAGNDILYWDRFTRFRDLAYNFYVNLYASTDLTILSPHFFDGFKITDSCYAEYPNYQVFAVRNDGRLLAFTYLKEQDVYAWSSYDTSGEYVSVASIPEGDGIATYQIVARRMPTWNGGELTFFQERMAPRSLDNGNGYKSVENAWYIDCAVRHGPDIQDVDCVPFTGADIVGQQNVRFTAVPGTFTDVDPTTGTWVIRGNGGKAIVTTNTGGAFDTVECTIVDAFATFPYEFDRQAMTGARIPDLRDLMPGQWSCTEEISEVSGLERWNGRVVQIFVDGGDQGVRTVDGGAITLDNPGSIVLVGLNYEADGETLPIDPGQPTVSGKLKKIPEVSLIVQDTRGLSIGQVVAGKPPQLFEFKDRTPGINPMGQAVPLIDGLLRITIGGSYQQDGQLHFRQAHPLPATILAFVPKVTVGDDDG